MLTKELKSQPKPESNTGMYIKLLLTTAAAAASVYLGGPIAATTARTLFTHAYDYKYGIPAMYHLSYWLTYMPLREHVGALGYSYGSPILGTIAAPVVYKSTDAIKWLGDKAARLGSIFKKTPPPQVDFDKELEALIAQFAKLKISDEEVKKLPDITFEKPFICSTLPEVPAILQIDLPPVHSLPLEKLEHPHLC